MSEEMLTPLFRLVDARSGLRFLSPGSVQIVICSPPYFRCRDFTPNLPDGANCVGVWNKTDPALLGHEETPEDFVSKLASTFGDGKYLFAGTKIPRDERRRGAGSLWVVLGDTFARSSGGKSGVTRTRGEALSVHHLFAAAMRRRGWSLWQEIIRVTPNPPPSGSAKVRCNPCHDFILWFVREGHVPFFRSSEIREPGKTPAGTAMTQAGGKKYGRQKGPPRRTFISDGMRSRRDVWVIPTSSVIAPHVAPFSAELPQVIIKACSIPGDLVVDPFAGLGTTGFAAERLGRRSICLDIYDHRNLKRVQNNMEAEDEEEG